MHFDEVIKDIERLLVGKQLDPINPKTPSLFISQIDHKSKKYFVSADANKKGVGRSIDELQYIWSDLLRKGFSNVDQSLYGSGSSRNQPETILANLPYVQHFLYKKKKHILLRSESIREPATLSEVQGADFRKLRKQLDSYFNISVKEVAKTQKSLLSAMRSTFDSVLKKYPGESAVRETESLLHDLEEMQTSFEEGIVSIDLVPQHPETNDLIRSEEVEIISLDDWIESEEVSGIGSETNSENDDSDRARVELLKDNETPKSNTSTRIRQLTPVLSLIYDRIHFGDIELQPDFQRKDRIWPQDKKSKLIESILMRLPLPAFYFAEKADGSWVVVDGLQRITTVYDFMRGDFLLDKLEVLTKHNGQYFKDLTRQEQREVREYAITAYLIDDQHGDSNMVIELFHRINTHGLKLSEQEIRSALNQGTSVKFLRYLASLRSFKEATHYKVRADRQKDMELCLSALSFMLLGYQNFKHTKYSDFLSDAMQALNKFPLQIDNNELLDDGLAVINSNSSMYIKLAEKYVRALEIANEIFGENSFIKDPSTGKKAISKPLYELVITYFSELNDSNVSVLISRSTDFIDMLYSAIDKDENIYAKWDSKVYTEANRGFLFSISTSTGKKSTIDYRFRAFREILKQSTGIDIELSPILENK
jgi:hypothetical protein